MPKRTTITIDPETTEDLKSIKKLFKKLPYREARRYKDVSAICREGISKVRKAIERKVKKLQSQK